MFKSKLDDIVTVPDAPAVPELTFRCFRGEMDYPAMVAVWDGCREIDQYDWIETVDDIARSYRHLVNCDPYRDMLFVETSNDGVIGYSRLWWEEELDGQRLYYHFAALLPEWRGEGIRRAMLHFNERRIREIAAGHPQKKPRFFEAWASEVEVDWSDLLTDEGYESVRYEFKMVRPNLDDIPELSLPGGLEVRPVPPEHYRTVWNAAEEAFRDHWGARQWHDEWYEEWLESPTFTPQLWQVAWDGDEVAGMVLNYINEKENQSFKRKRGYTEDISVRRPWRRRGLARALIARSLRVLKDQGMTEAALSVDTQNPNGALRLYESMGYRQIKQWTTFRKPLSAQSLEEPV